MPTPEDVFEFISSTNSRWVDLQFFDVEGRLQRTTVNAREFDQSAFSKGIHCGDLKEVFGWSDEGELVLLPDPNTYGKVPWEPSTVRLICNLTVSPKGERFLKDSRYVSERAAMNAKAMGFTNITVGTSFEFYVLDNVTVDKMTPQRGPNCLIESREAPWTPSPLWNTNRAAYFAQPFDTLYTARTQISETVEDNFRYTIEKHYHGRSASGQQALSLAPIEMLWAADAFQTTKFVIRNLAFIANSLATFMPLPIMGEKGSQMLSSITLWKGDENAFYDSGEEYAQLSQTGRYFIGGILEHAEALMVFANPTPNSYRRLAADPHQSTWGKRSSSAVVHVPSEIKNDRKGKGVSFNLADPSANPYLVFGTVVAAGLDGVKNKKDPGKGIDEDLSEKDEEELKELKIKPLPANMMEAIAALESDNKFLKGLVPSELLESYLEDKIEEHKEQSKRPSAYEFEKYFNM